MICVSSATRKPTPTWRLPRPATSGVIVSCRTRQPLAGNLVEAAAVTVEHRRPAARRLPAPHRHVYVLWPDLDGEDAPSGRLTGDDLRPGTAERLVADFAGARVLAHRDGKHLDRLRRRMLGLLPDLHRRQGP